MRAVVLRAYGGPQVLATIEERPDPVAAPGEVVIRVRAFGLNRSDVHLRTGVATGVELPIVPGIECVGERADGTRVAAMMGGMSRSRDGAYATHVVVPEDAVLPVGEAGAGLDWATLGALPEMLQTAYGSLTTGLDLQPGQTLLIRGGTSSVGLAAAVLAAEELGATVLATSRSRERLDVLRAVGVTHPLVEDGDVAAQVRALFPGGVDAALELVGTGTLPDTLAATRVHGTVCFTGMLGGEWIVEHFYPIGYLPSGVRLTAYGGEAANLPAAVFDRFCAAVAAGRLRVPTHVYEGLEAVVRAHEDLDAGRVVGKLVVAVP